MKKPQLNQSFFVQQLFQLIVAIPEAFLYFLHDAIKLRMIFQGLYQRIQFHK